jgi:ABC-type dipeptide/oligopeptide/nickel transport system permease subunit
MEQIDSSTVSLRTQTRRTFARQMSLGRSLTLVIFTIVLLRLLTIGLTALFALVPQLDFFTNILRSINNLHYVIAIPVALVIYFWVTGGDQEGQYAQLTKNLFRQRTGVLGFVIIALLVFISDFAPVIATHDPLLAMIGLPGEVGRLPGKPPCIALFGCKEPQHILGLDLNARDLFSRIIWGSRTSLSVGIASVTFAIVIGTALGLVSGFAGGWIDSLLMRLMDVLLAFPSLLLAITIVTIKGKGLENALLAIAIVSIPVYARLARASTLSVKELEFITAERALGANPARILFTQVFPNTLTPLIVQGTLGIGTAVLDAAGLSFLGLGAQPPLPEWGAMLGDAINYVFTAPHLVFFPGLAIMLTVLGFNLLGDGLRDALDPRLNRI